VVVADRLTTPEALIALYNASIPGDHPKVVNLSPCRLRLARKAIATFPEVTFWREVCGEIEQSPFLRGLTTSPGRRAVKRDFDWLIAKGQDGIENCVKVHEGKYRETLIDQATAQYGPSAARRLTQIERMVAKGAPGGARYA
jgi:hypothetical protein